jgi:hypothetical protein
MLSHEPGVEILVEGQDTDGSILVMHLSIDPLFSARIDDLIFYDPDPAVVVFLCRGKSGPGRVCV